jgi:hypothetical protein
MKTLFISAVRHKIKSDLDRRRTAIFTRHLLRYLQIFAFLGVIFPVLIGVDYFLTPTIKTEMLTNKKHKIWSNRKIDYFFYFNERYIKVDGDIFEQIRVGSMLDLHHTPIFDTFVVMLCRDGEDVYASKPFNIYGWPRIITALTFFLSIFLLLKNRPESKTEHDLLITAGVINTFLCVFMLAFLLFPSY